MAGFDLVPGGQGHNYTGMLTRSIVFSMTLLVFLAATGMTLAAIIVPQWISFSSETNHNTQIHYTYGLHRRCSNSDSRYLDTYSLTLSPPPFPFTCKQFPQDSDCEGDNRYFCSMWRSVGFLMSFAIVIEGMTIAAFAILLAGGKQRREQGWGVMALLVVIAALVQAACMALIAYLYENDDKFFPGWYLDRSWVMCTTSWCFQALCAAAITAAALILPSEGGYELIPDHHGA